MARTASTMLALGTPAPDFSLPDVVSGRTISRDQFGGMKGLLVMFLCSHCPFVKHVEPQLAQLGYDYAVNGLGIVGISSNDATAYPEDAPAGLREQAKRNRFTFQYLYDESQEVARAFQAVCTPEFYLFDAEGKLAYRGQLDESRPGNGIPADGRDLRAAIEAVMAGRPVATEQRPSVGCGIKWKTAGA
ncbi:MAG: thioredoxin family protein [Acidobacteriaceae bacterium]